MSASTALRFSPFTALLALLLVSLVPCLVLSQSDGACPGQYVTGYINDPTFSEAVAFPDNQVKFTDIILSTEQTVVSLQLQIAGGSDVAQDTNIILGLYSADPVIPNAYNLLASTAPITVPATQNQPPATLTGPVLLPVQVSPGTYYVGRLSDFAGLQLFADGNYSDSGEDVIYPVNGALPSAVTTSFSTTRVCAGILGCPCYVKGDPVFVGFRGQVYQVHGLPNEVFGLISTANLQLNALFKFIGEGQAMTATKQAEVQMRSMESGQPLPTTTAFGHPGTFLGAIGLQVGGHRLLVEAGPYSSGFGKIELDGVDITAESSSLLLQERTQQLTIHLEGASRLVVSTSELSFTLVNSDSFMNLERVRLASSVQPMEIDGVLGQSADPARYFPEYAPTAGANADAKSDFQRHMTLDYLVLDHDLFSTDFVANRFNPANQLPAPVKAQPQRRSALKKLAQLVDSE